MISFRSRLPVVAASIALASAGVLLSQEQDAEASMVSGPQAGTALTPVKVYASDGPRRGSEFDAAAELGKAPCALLFIHELTRNTAPVLRGLDTLATEFAVLGFKSYSIMLSGDRTAGESQLKRVNGSLRLANPLVLSFDGAEGPGNYALNRKAALTVVLAKEGKVVKSLALTDTGPNDVPVIRREIEAVAGAIPKDASELRKLIVERLPSDAAALKDLVANQALELRKLKTHLAELRQQPRGAGMNRQAPQGRPRRDPPPQEGRRPAANDPPAQRQGKPPEDPELNTLLRSFIRQTNDVARADEVFAEIVARAAKSDELQGETVEMFKLMLSFRDRYGSEHAQGLAEAFLKEHGGPGKDE